MMVVHASMTTARNGSPSLFSFVPRHERRQSSKMIVPPSHYCENKALESLLSLNRGGSLEDDSEEYDYESEEEEEDLSEEDDDLLSEDMKKRSLSKSTLSKTLKLQSKKVSHSKATINASLQTSKKKKKKKSSGSLLQKLGIPYIVRACMNPLTVLAMTKAYFASLFNIAYLEEESSQGLRSALEAKAKKEASSGGKTKGKRTMKPGRSKSLADLPALSA